MKKKLAIALVGAAGFVYIENKTYDRRMLKHEKALDQLYIDRTVSQLRAKALVLALTGQTKSEEYNKLYEEAAFLKSIQAYHS